MFIISPFSTQIREGINKTMTDKVIAFRTMRPNLYIIYQIIHKLQNISIVENSQNNSKIKMNKIVCKYLPIDQSWLA